MMELEQREQFASYVGQGSVHASVTHEARCFPLLKNSSHFACMIRHLQTSCCRRTLCLLVFDPLYHLCVSTQSHALTPCAKFAWSHELSGIHQGHSAGTVGMQQERVLPTLTSLRCLARRASCRTVLHIALHYCDLGRQGEPHSSTPAVKCSSCMVNMEQLYNPQ